MCLKGAGHELMLLSTPSLLLFSICYGKGCPGMT